MVGAGHVAPNTEDGEKVGEGIAKLRWEEDEKRGAQRPQTREAHLEAMLAAGRAPHSIRADLDTGVQLEGTEGQRD